MNNSGWSLWRIRFIVCQCNYRESQTPWNNTIFSFINFCTRDWWSLTMRRWQMIVGLTYRLHHRHWSSFSIIIITNWSKWNRQYLNRINTWTHDMNNRHYSFNISKAYRINVRIKVTRFTICIHHLAHHLLFVVILSSQGEGQFVDFYLICNYKLHSTR